MTPTIPATPQPPAAGRPAGFTLVEIIVVISIIALLLGLVVPSLNSMWAESKGAETEQFLKGTIASARARAYGDRERGLFFMLDGDVQKIFPIEAEPVDPTDAADKGVVDAAAADRFRIADGNVVMLSRPFRVTPRAAVDETIWDATDLAATGYDQVDSDLEHHRNFFTMIFSPEGRLIVGRDVLIHDPDGDGDQRGDRTGLPVSGTSNWQTESGDQPLPKASGPGTGSDVLTDMIVDSGDVAINFPSVDGLLVYDDATFAEQPTPELKREYLIRTGAPLYVSRLSGAVVRGPLGENE